MSSRAVTLNRNRLYHRYPHNCSCLSQAVTLNFLNYPHSCSYLSRIVASRLCVVALGCRLPASHTSRAIPSASSGQDSDLAKHLHARHRGIWSGQQLGELHGGQGIGQYRLPDVHSRLETGAIRITFPRL